MGVAMGMSAGHLIVKQLELAGVNRVYSVPGESFLEILDGLYDSPIVNVVARHEGGAGFMALAEARLTGAPGVALVTRGPGAANAQIAVHTAYQDHTPLLLFIGLIPVHDRNRESFQEFDPKAWFGSTAKQVFILDDPDSAATLVSRAYALAHSGRPGPVIIGLPEDVIRQTTNNEPVPQRNSGRCIPAQNTAQQLGAMLGASQKPMLILGGEDWQQDTSRRLASWAERCNIPVATDFRSYDAISHSSPAFVGSLGYGRSEELARRYDEADLVIYMGCVRSDVLSDGYVLGKSATTVVVNPDPDLQGHDGRIDLAITCGMRDIVHEIEQFDTQASSTWLSEARDEHLKFSIPEPHQDSAVDLYSVMRELDLLLKGEATITYGAGNHALWAARYLRHEHQRSLVAPKNGAMGMGVPSAVAAKLVHPERTVVSIAGDGCFMMNGQELATAAAYDAPIHVLVVDNGCFATICEHQERFHPGRPSGTELTNPDFAALGRSYGFHGETITKNEEIPSALRRAFSSPSGSVIHVLTDPTTRSPRTTVNARSGGEIA